MIFYRILDVIAGKGLLFGFYVAILFTRGKYSVLAFMFIIQNYSIQIDTTSRTSHHFRVFCALFTNLGQYVGKPPLFISVTISLFEIGNKVIVNRRINLSDLDKA